MYKFILLSLALLFSVLLFAENEFYIKEEPTWIEQIIFDKNYHLFNDNKEDGGTYLLIDFQEDVKLKESFRHYVIKIEEETGIQNYSDIWVNYEPAYEKLLFHQLIIHRNGKVLQRLKEEDFTIVQNETDLDRKIYNGNYSAGINIEDVQVGDIIEYSYTIKGENPVFNNKYFDFFNIEYSVPINKLFIQVNYPRHRNIAYKLIKSDLEPVKLEKGDNICLKWELTDVSEIVTNSNLPKWYIAYGSIQFTEFYAWQNVIDWSKPLYPSVKIEGTELEIKYNDLTKSSNEKEAKINSLIRFVQDEIRYVGIEVDEHSHKPHDPLYVYKKRFGDCKDKSYLLVTLLNHLGIEAWPAYVNSGLLHNINLYMPSPSVFNHVIVSFYYKDKLYFVDPTISNQRGSFENLYHGDYRSALILSDKYPELVNMPMQSIEKMVINEYIEAPDTIKPAKYKVVTTYYGSEADRNRINNQNMTQKEMESSYLNFYDYIYPNMEVDGDFKYEDNEIENTVIIEENYFISNFWNYNDSRSINDYVAYIDAPNIENYITNPSQRNRTMPFALYYPIEIENEIEFNISKEIDIEEIKGEIANACFVFNYKTTVNGESLFFNYSFKTLKDFVSVNELEQYFKDIDEISNILWGEFTYGSNGKAGTEDRLNWLLIILTTFFIIILVFFATKFYQRDLVVTSISREPLPIGGWLVLPVIGLFLTPIIIIYQMYTTEYFSLTGWEFVSVKDSAGYDVMWAVTFVVELLMNCIFLVYNIFLIVLLLKKRTIFPIHYVSFRVLNLIFVIANVVMASQITSEYFVVEDDFYGEITKSIIGAAIWIPYMLMSERVKDTFINKFRKPSAIE